MTANARVGGKKRIYNRSDNARVPFTMEECYDIIRQLFHNEEDA